jgi:hypothetical protein
MVAYGCPKENPSLKAYTEVIEPLLRCKAARVRARPSGGRQELRPSVGVIGRKIVGELPTLDHTGRGLPLGWIVVAAIVYFGWTALQWLIATDIRRQDERRVHRSNGPESPGSEPPQPVGVWEAVKRWLSSGYGAD